MGKRYKDPGVKCPYYCSEEPNKIYCEGPEEQVNWLHLAWGDEKKKKEYKRKNCKARWEKCPIACMLKEQRDG